MKIRAFKLQTDTSATMDKFFDAIAKLAIGDRVCDTSSGELSLKEARRTRSGEWLLDFTKFRHVGPGKAAKDRANEDFDLKDDEFFGEETAALYFPATSDLVIQFNQHGPRSSSIEQYLQVFTANLKGKVNIGFSGVTLSAIMRVDQVARYRSMQHIKSVEFKMFIPGALQVQPAKRQSVSSILSNSVVPGAENISVTINAARSRSLNVNQVGSMVKDLLGMTADVTHLMVKGADSANDSAVLLDLLGAQLVAERPILATSRKRHALNERWGALRNAYDEWKSDGHI